MNTASSTTALLPAKGSHSPVFAGPAATLRRAYYLALGFLVLATLIALGAAFVNSRSEIRGRGARGPAAAVGYYFQLGPPPSILGADALPAGPAAPGTSAAGTPTPVPDALAMQETAPPDAAVAAGSGSGSTLGELTAVVPVWQAEVKPEPIRLPEVAFGPGVRLPAAGSQAFIKALVDLDGHIAAVELLVSSGSTAFDAAALVAARRALFTPARYHGKAVRVWVSIPYTFAPREEP